MYLNEKYTKTVRIMFINTIKNFFFIDFIVSLFSYQAILFYNFRGEFGVSSSENDVFDGYNKTKRGVYYDD